jgi:hypothetical protein
MVTKYISKAGSELYHGATPGALLNDGVVVGLELDIDEDIMVSFVIPDDWDGVSDFSINVYWYTVEAYSENSAEIQWQINYHILTPNGNFVPSVDYSYDNGDTNIAMSSRTITKTTIGQEIDATSVNRGDILTLQLKRIAIDDGTNPTLDPNVIAISFEYTADRLGEST